MSRKAARTEAFKLIFAIEGQKGNYKEITENYLTENKVKDENYLTTVVNGVFENKEIIDKTISQNLKGWKIERVSKVALAVMRLSIFEMQKLDDIPVSVSINEALCILEEYDGEQSKSFVNGVLGSVDKLIKKEELF